MSIDPRVTVVELYELARNRSLWSYGFFDDLESHGSSWLQLRDWCLFARGWPLYTSPSPRDRTRFRMPSSA